MNKDAGVMAHIEAILDTVNGVVWGPVMLILILGTGLYLMVGLGFMPLRRLSSAIRLMLRGRRTGADERGEITPYQSLMTALAATVGTGNIAGVATAIALGGPGAIFWMWMTALVGMATKYAEAVLAVRFREVDERGRTVGGPMYYIRNGLGARWAWLAWLFALFTAVAAFGIGNMVQANSLADVFQSTTGTPPWVTGVVLTGVVFFVIVGGLRRIASWSDKLVPFMAAVYVAGSLLVIACNAQHVPGALALIFRDAFSDTAAAGGFAGAAMIMGLRYGVARGIFSNEAGLGSAAIAHAAAQTRDPARLGLVAMLGTFIDTIVVCTMTALVILTVHVPLEIGGVLQQAPAWMSGKTGAGLTALAYGSGLPGGEWIVTIGLVLFVFTTLLGWSYFGERAAEYLCGVRVILPYRLLWVACVFVGCVVKLDLVWNFADTMNAMMAVPNLIALVLLSGVVFAISKASPATARGDLDAPPPDIPTQATRQERR
ncbi:MAG: sodium:alanine symporter family protein [Alphaproteobacteria bacterium 65-7]|nr:MAG: sodium:alanine symporter family protein [Alphaproteobacteria bacterium 65-7]